MDHCPACKSNSVNYLDKCSVEQDFTQNILPATYKMLRCNNCNLFFKDYIPNDNELSDFYNSLSDNEWNYLQDNPYEKYLKQIFKTLPDDSNILDVGCNTGRLLKGETKRLNCYGVEMNLKAAKVAETVGIKIIAQKVENDNLGENEFDIITLIDVFEHLNDPIPFVKQLIRALKPNGKLYVFTGRTDCLPSYLCGSYYWYYKPAQHLIFLNSKFIEWYKENNDDLKISIIPMRHFYSNFRLSVYQITWHAVWRFFSPSSPYRIFSVGRFAKMRSPFMITSWKDHVFFIIEKSVF